MTNNKAQSQETFAQRSAKNEHFAELVTTTLANQVNENLKEDKRTNYGRSYYPTTSPVTTEPKP
jgi:hypothetical protein